MTTTHPPSAPKTKTPLAQIAIADVDLHYIALRWQDAQARLRACASNLTGEQMRDVTCVVTWSDGFSATISQRLRATAFPGASYDLAATVRQTWTYYAGFARPEHLTDEQYDAIVNDDAPRKHQATLALARYALTDAPPPSSDAAPQPQATAPTPEELTRVQAIIADFVRRSEATNAPRALAMELRKALAALARATEVPR